MKGISINGKKLHVNMLPLPPYDNCSSVVSQRYPINRIIFDQQEGGLLSLKKHTIGVRLWLSTKYFEMPKVNV